MLSNTDLKIGTKCLINEEPYLVTKYSQSKQARGGSVVKVLVRNLLTGATLSKTVQGNEKLEEADVTRGTAQYTYNDGDTFYFMDNETFDQFELSKDQVSDNFRFLVEGSDVDILRFNNTPISIEMSPKVEMEVKETPPGLKGDTASGGTKPATLETGYVVQVPLFIKENDKIRINTETGEYVERV